MKELAGEKNRTVLNYFQELGWELQRVRKAKPMNEAVKQGIHVVEWSIEARKIPSNNN